MKIVWIKSELLHPIDKGGKIRTYHMLKELKREHQITYLTLDDGSAAPDARQRAEDYCHKLVCVPHATRPKFSAGFYAELAANLASRLPYAIKKYESPLMRREIVRQMERERPDLLVCDFLAPSVNLPDEVPCAAVLFQHNVEAMIWKRHYEVQKGPIRRAYLYNQWQKMRAYERAACMRFDRVVAVSREDREAVERDYGIEFVADVPTGVDTDYFYPRGDERCDPHGLVFTGSMDWLPNQDAMDYFAEQILPRIKQSAPGVRLTVVGRNPYPGLVELSRRDPSITVTGRVEDVRPYIERAAAYIVPIRIGGGTRLKIYEAMAMGKAVVSTRVGAEGLPVCDGAELLLADTPDDFAGAVVRLLKDANLRRELGARAAEVVREGFGWDKVAQKFSEVCQNALRPGAESGKESDQRRVASGEIEAHGDLTFS